MFKCWNCHGLGLIPFLNEDDPEKESYVYGDECPICHGESWVKVCFKKLWMRLGQMKSNFQIFMAANEAELKKLLRKRAFYRFMFDLTMLALMFFILYLFIRMASNT